MTTVQRIVVEQNNDETLQFTVTNHDSIPSDQGFNITGMSVDFWIKLTQNTPDSDPSTTHLSTSTGEVTLTTPIAGVLQVQIPRAKLASPGTLWHHLDITSGNQLRTASKGPFVVDPV